jgi:hypothetical protein
MALTGYPFPYDVDQLLGGAVRILYAPTTEPIPTSIDDVIDMTDPYAPAGTWVDLGATRDSFSYSRGFDTSGYEIQQLAGNVIEEITDISRTIEVSFADFRPEHLAMIEGRASTVVESVAAVAGSSAQETVKFGSFSSLERYRFAFISRRPKQAGVVNEPSGTYSAANGGRGRFFMGVAYEAQLSADEVSMEQAKGELTAAGVTFTLFPASGEASGEEYGAWFDETAGTINAV